MLRAVEPPVEVQKLSLTMLETGKKIYLPIHPFLLNAFASWCTPCALEHPVWMSARGVTIMGLGWKDTPENIKKWIAGHGNPYAQLWQDAGGNASIPLGISGVPETFLVDGAGLVRYRFSGPVTEDILNAEILPALRALDH